MNTTAKLYPNGLLTVECRSRTRAAFSGLRGRIAVICFNANREAHWISQIFQCSTRCAIFDPTCSSQGTNAFFQELPEPVGRLTESIDIINFDESRFGQWREQLIQARELIQSSQTIAQEIKGIVNLISSF
ncbi:MAG: hypothetical protein DCF19_09300 [Pseudanabaena frigida]|uniref:Uncharacterized protein n=1 Tax=Pseudanabaena frigida TaxID=945775 RepID=A0A2W4WIL7_9CYAN|nr:MAG: hypothetical protein DCF19_09300 [Pseudanabaena frigida]